MSFDEAVRLVRLRDRVIAATREALRADGMHKSSEAAVSASFNLPSMFDDDQSAYWGIEVYSYVVGPSRNHSWFGKTLTEALAKAEEAVSAWCMPYEMERMDRLMSHASDCAVNNAPAMPIGECDCGAEDDRQAILYDNHRGEDNARMKHDDDLPA